MISDPDIYRTAAVLVKEHGEDALLQAGMRADELLDQGDMDGKAVWLRILAAVKELLVEVPEGMVH